MHYDRQGNVIPGSEEIIGHLQDKDLILEAEADHAFRKTQGRGSRQDLLDEGSRARKRKSDRPTVPEMPMVIGRTG
jgi:hypothetical protein